MKRIFEYFGILSLACFSFFLTEKTSLVVQEVDDIMIQIKEHQEEYQIEGESSVLFEQYIIPGLSTKVVNIEKSYQEMEKIGVYDDNYYVYNIEKNEESIDNHLDKYIIQGNTTKRMVSLIFLLEDYDLQKVLMKTSGYQVSFVIPNYSFSKQEESIEKAIQMGNEFLISEEEEQSFLSLSQKLDVLGGNPKICYNQDEKKEFLSLCQNNQFYSITTKNYIRTSPFKKTKELLQPGIFLVYEVNNQLLEELPNILAYIESRGYQIAPVSIHIKED